MKSLHDTEGCQGKGVGKVMVIIQDPVSVWRIGLIVCRPGMDNGLQRRLYEEVGHSCPTQNDLWWSR